MKHRKIVLAFDSFKGSVSSLDLSRQMERLGRAITPCTEVVAIPISDGGEGLIEALEGLEGYSRIPVWVHDPLMRLREACYLWEPSSATAVIEMATAAGLPLLAMSERNPLVTTTYGVGELVRHALDRGVRRIWMGLGGSATNDAGVGMFEALGVRFYDSYGTLLTGSGEHLGQIVHIDQQGLDPRLRQVDFSVACDVRNPFYGEQGAAAVFAPQKGATPPVVEQLDRGLRQFAQLLFEVSSIRVDRLPGSGAAGGLGGTLAALLGASLVPGIELILSALHFDLQIEGAGLVITGEGRMDRQTLMGKAPGGVLCHGCNAQIPVLGVAGRVEDRVELLRAGFSDLFELSPREMPLIEAMSPTGVAQNLCRLFQTPRFLHYWVGHSS